MHILDGKIYIGSAKCLSSRKEDHFSGSMQHSSPHLRHAIEKYGKDNFKFEVLEYVEDVAQLIPREQFYIDRAISEGKVLYNIALVAGSNLGVKFKWSEETLKKRSIALKGKPQSTESNKKRSIAMTGRKHTDEHRRKNSISHLGIPSKNKGKKFTKTEATRKLLSQVLSGVPKTEAHRKSQSEGMKRAWERKKEAKREISILS